MTINTDEINIHKLFSGYSTILIFDHAHIPYYIKGANSIHAHTQPYIISGAKQISKGFYICHAALTDPLKH